VRWIAVAAILVLASGESHADEQRAHVNYMLHCQGCHLPQTEGFPGKVPAIKDFVGYFLHSKEGREFLVRVPGVAQSALSDEEVAELMNWLVVKHSADQLPADFVPFTSAEVAALRVNPETDPERRRGEILAAIARQLPALADDLAGAR
jgi:mono/diheme cytochrome c family protein